MHSRTLCSPTLSQASKGYMCSSPMALTPYLEVHLWLFKLIVLETDFNMVPCSHPLITHLLFYLPRDISVILKKYKWREIKDMVPIYVCEYYMVEPPYPRTAQSGLQSYEAQLKYSWTYFTVFWVCTIILPSSVNTISVQKETLQIFWREPPYWNKNTQPLLRSIPMTSNVNENKK